MMIPKHSRTELFLAQLCEVYYFENQLVSALKLLAEAATDAPLKALFLAHRQETLTQVERLEAVFAELNEMPKAFPTCAVDGLMDDGRWTIHILKNDPALDGALHAAAQKTEALEVAMYNGLIQSAMELGHAKVAELCKSNLDEERAAQQALTALNNPPQHAGEVEGARV